MANINTSDFKEIVRNIENNKILLPDFQREFVWKDEEMQKKIVASVLAKMPVGSILLLASKPDEYSSKIIGCKRELDTSELSDEVEFLLDGQQRITVLTNVFSSIIHDLCKNSKDLVAPQALKRRFFLRVPRWKDAEAANEEDWFGVKNLLFPLSNPDSDDPEFLSSQIVDSIEVLPFNANDDKSYNPKNALDSKLVSDCSTLNNKGYLIPLFLLIPPIDQAKAGAVKFYFSEIIDDVAKKIKGDIWTTYSSSTSYDEKRDFIKNLVESPDEQQDILDSENEDLDAVFKVTLSKRARVWGNSFTEYLQSCISAINLHQIRVKSSQRGRAIDIYENLNRGGVSLSTFDLIMAKVVKVDKQNFHQRMINAMQSEKEYPKNIVHPHILPLISKEITNKKYNATMAMRCYNRNKNELIGKYIDIFLDVLGLYCYNKDFDIDNFKIDYMKKDKILNLDPEAIHENCDDVIKAIDRAMFFLQTRCGIRSISEINYSLAVVLLAVIFLKDDYFNSMDVNNLLEAWYWGVLFSGEFDKDQNVRMINNLKSLLRTNETRDTNWMYGPDCILSNILDAQNFSDKALVLLEKASDERYPKVILRTFICEYMLSRTYDDLVDVDPNHEVVSVFHSGADKFQMHHIIPLGSIKKISDMNTASIRNKQDLICNSPLNFVWITEDSNRAISDDPLDKYAKEIKSTAKAKLHISVYTTDTDADTDQKIHGILEQRFDYLKGDIENTVQALLANWKAGNVTI